MHKNHPRKETIQTQNLSNFFYILVTKAYSVQNSVHLQKLSPLGEAHSIVSSLQLWVQGQLAAHHGHLLIHVHEKPIFCVLRGERHEKFRA